MDPDNCNGCGGGPCHGDCEKLKEIQDMRNPQRIPAILDKIQKAWEMVPDWRLGQFVSNMMGTGVQDVFYTEDDTWEELIDKFIEENESRLN